MNSHQRHIFRRNLMRNGMPVPEWAQPFGGPLRHACDEHVRLGRMTSERRDEILGSNGHKRQQLETELVAIATPTVEIDTHSAPKPSWLNRLIAAIILPIRHLIPAQA